MTLDEFAHACLWQQAVCLECEAVFDPPESTASRECPECGSDAVFLARDLARIETWLESIERLG